MYICRVGVFMPTSNSFAISHMISPCFEQKEQTVCHQKVEAICTPLPYIDFEPSHTSKSVHIDNSVNVTVTRLTKQHMMALS